LEMQRRSFAKMLISAGAAASISSGSIAEIVYFQGNSQPDSDLPEDVKQMIRNVLKLDYRTLNTDHDGSFLVEGLLRFTRRGFNEGVKYAENWFNYHLENDRKLTDEEYFNQYHGSRSRIIRDGPLTFSIYSANLAVVFPLYDLYRITGNHIAKEVCIDIADAVLHYSARDRYGMLAHDDINSCNFSIPEGLYFGIRALAIASELTRGEISATFIRQAVYQLRQGIKYFLDKDKGLVRTGWFKGLPSGNYWCRSQGWLIWSVSGLLRHLPASHPDFNEFRSVLKLIADAAVRYQSVNGGFHVFVDDPSSPEEVTGMAMVLASVKEAVRNRWIPDEYGDLCERGLNYILKSIDGAGNVKNVYNGWALPAEERRTDLMDRGYRGFVNGIILISADELTR